MGISVSRPVSDLEYDRITEYGGKMCRVQVKMVIAKRKGENRYRLRLYRSRKVLYKNIDVMAVYLKEDDIWMVIPFHEVDGMIDTNVTTDGSYKGFINNWGILYGKQKDDQDPAVSVRSKARSRVRS